MIMLTILSVGRLSCMNKLKTLFVVLSVFTFCVSAAYASGMDGLIKKSNLNKTSTIAVSVKDAKSGRVVYQYNENKLMNPASVQKIFTMKSAYEELGSGYTFKTTAYLDKKGNLYIKLGADPTLTRNSLITLLKSVKEKYNKPVNDIVLDSSIIDNRQWGTGWMWDDDTNELLPKFSPFSINENKIEITLSPGKNGSNPEIRNKSSYTMHIVNRLKNGKDNNISLERMPWTSSDLTYVTGDINSPLKIKLPVDSVERYFTGELNAALAGAGIKHNGALKFAPLPSGVNKVAEISSAPLNEIVNLTLKDSNNFYAEMIFKTAGGHFAKDTGTAESAVKMFDNYYSDLKNYSYEIVDGCGISRNNLLTADWITDALNKIYNEKNSQNFINLLAKPMQGTMSDRLLNISLKLRAKTGTASGISSIAGYIDTKSGKKYSFAILIQNHNMDTIDVKKFEDSLINEIYKM